MRLNDSHFHPVCPEGSMQTTGMCLSPENIAYACCIAACAMLAVFQNWDQWAWTWLSTNPNQVVRSHFLASAFWQRSIGYMHLQGSEGPNHEGNNIIPGFLCSAAAPCYRALKNDRNKYRCPMNTGSVPEWKVLQNAPNTHLRHPKASLLLNPSFFVLLLFFSNMCVFRCYTQ